MAKLNEVNLQVLFKAGKPVVVAAGDGSGLSLRVTRTGATWQLRYRHAGKPHWLTVGQYPECSLREAKKRATRERARIDEGVNPVAERRRSKLALRAAKTFRDLWLDFEARALSDLKPGTQVQIRMYVNNDILPRIGDMSTEEDAGAEIIHMVEQVAKRTDCGGRRVFQLTSAIYSHGIAKHLAKFNPCAHLKLKAILGKRPACRPKVSLSEDQLRDVLTKLPTLGRRNALALKIILATCVRKSELRLSRPEHLDLEAGAWTIPGENSKNGKSLVVPLAPVVVEWFRELLALTDGKQWVLPGRRPTIPMSANTLNVALDRLPDAPMFTPHDLRRTARTHLGRLGVDVITAEKCLNHSLGGLVDVYDRGDYFLERRKALELWADFLVRCENPAGNVVSLRKAG